MADKGDLARAGTIEITSKEGKAFLEKNLTNWKKPQLLDHFGDDSASSAQQDDSKSKKGGGKKGAMAKAGTMITTAKEGNELLGGEKLGDTRLMTKKKPAVKGASKRAGTIKKVVEEAEELVGKINTSEGRKLRKRSVPAPAPSKANAAKSPMKKARTMVNTAKEGRALLAGHPALGDTREVTKMKAKAAKRQ